MNGLQKFGMNPRYGWREEAGQKESIMPYEVQSFYVKNVLPCTVCERVELYLLVDQL
jgi:hypothetical protein